MNPQEDEDYMSLVALILVLFILMLFCVAILIVGFMNTRKILKSSILFYALLGVFLLTKLVTELYFAVSFIMIVEDKTSEESKKSTLSTFEGASRNGMFVTDFVICSLFLILMKEFHTLQYEALLDQDSSTLKKIWSVVQLFVFACFAVLISLYNFKIFNFTQAAICSSILNLIPWILYISINLHANITMTGAITEQEITDRLKKTNKRLFWFFFSRGLQAAYEILLITDIGNTPFVNVILNLEKAKGQPIVILSCFAIYLFTILLTEMIPLIISIQTPTIQMMQTIAVTSIKESILESNSSFISLIKKTETEEQVEKEIDLKEFETMDILSVGQNGFGGVKKGRMRGRIVVLRTIETELSKYLLEEIASEIQEMKKLQIQGLMPIKYSILQPKFISFITDYYESNLKKVIDSKNSINQSLRIMYELTNVVSELHKINLPHGTLKVNNIYIAGTHIKIADHGLLSLKKFMSITQGYSNKSIYTAPELLSGRHSVVVKPTKEGDIYALGMIMFEVFSGITVYRNLPIQEVEASFKQKQIRPKIPTTLPAQLQNLIRNCWQQEPSERPSIEEVAIVLREYKNKFN